MQQTQGQVRTVVANLIGVTRSSYADKMNCEDAILRITTDRADVSIAFIEQLAKLPGKLIYFQAYGTDGYGNEGSVFVAGGDASFIGSISNLAGPGLHVDPY